MWPWMSLKLWISLFYSVKWDVGLLSSLVQLRLLMVLPGSFVVVTFWFLLSFFPLSLLNKWPSFKVLLYLLSRLFRDKIFPKNSSRKRSWTNWSHKSPVCGILKHSIGVDTKIYNNMYFYHPSKSYWTFDAWMKKWTWNWVGQMVSGINISQEIGFTF